MGPRKNNFTRLIEEICQEEGIRMDSFSYYWAHRLTKDGQVRYIVGYQFPLNISSVKEVCQDKVLTYGILHDNGLPAALHVFLPNNIPSTGVTKEDNDAACQMMLDVFKTVVVKDNAGTGGNKVFKAETMDEVQEALDLIYKSTYSACISPYYEIEDEYRVILLDGEPQVIIRKDRQYTVNEQGEKVYENWRHNLGQGAVGVVLQKEEVPEGVVELAEKAVKVLGARFVSADVILVDHKPMILEINGGVMMEHLSSQSSEYYHIAKEIYRKAVLRSFE